MMDEGVRVVRKGRATETDSFASYKVSQNPMENP